VLIVDEGWRTGSRPSAAPLPWTARRAAGLAWWRWSRPESARP